MVVAKKSSARMAQRKWEAADAMAAGAPLLISRPLRQVVAAPVPGADESRSSRRLQDAHYLVVSSTLQNPTLAPPSTGKIAAVTKGGAGEHRYTAARPMSSRHPSFRMGVRFMMRAAHRHRPRLTRAL